MPAAAFGLKSEHSNATPSRLCKFGRGLVAQALLPVRLFRPTSTLPHETAQTPAAVASLQSLCEDHKSMNPPFRAEHVGSLLRPAELLAARASYAEGKITEHELRAIEDRAILAALGRQRSVGLDVYTDGEMRRGSWLTDMADAVEGFVPTKLDLEWKGPGGGTEGSTANVVGGKLRKLRKMTGHEVPFLKKTSPGPYKVTLPAPSNFVIASYKPGVTDKFYPDHAALLADLVEIVRDEIQWLVSEGVTYIQMDAPYYSHYFDPAQRERAKSAGRDPDKELEEAIRGDNAV